MNFRERRRVTFDMECLGCSGSECDWELGKRNIIWKQESLVGESALTRRWTERIKELEFLGEWKGS